MSIQTGICMLLPAVLSVWIFEKLTKTPLSRRDWLSFYCGNVIVLNLCCWIIIHRFMNTPVLDFASINILTTYILCALPLSALFPCIITLIRRNVRFKIETTSAADSSAAKRKRFALHILMGLSGIFLLLSGICYFAAAWYIDTYGALGFDAILYTLTSDLGGVDPGLINQCLSFIATNIPGILILLPVLLYDGKQKLIILIRNKRVYPLKQITALLLVFVLSFGFLHLAASETDFYSFIKSNATPSTLYEDEYRHPEDVQIEFPEKKRNLIYIMLESMETTFLSKEEGGALDYNVIPELHRLAEENVNFSPNNGVGGFTSMGGTTWTIGAMVAQTAGVPLKMPPGFEQNEYGEGGYFLTGIQGITTILHHAGYDQAVMFGSEAEFGGRRTYYETHGVNRIYDLKTAYEDGIVPNEYHNDFWGMEDHYLYEYAKQVLTEMSSGNQPFAFTLLTVDTHHVGGYVCKLCKDSYAERYENVFRCASIQAAAFIEWIQQQEFYEDTAIVIVGDHPSMDYGYFERNLTDTETERNVYNCFINASVQTDSMKNRQFSPFDLFPTTLAAMGCKLEGERLGLGTNLFSGEPTLLERYGYEALEEEIAKYSNYYINNFH